MYIYIRMQSIYSNISLRNFSYYSAIFTIKNVIKKNILNNNLMVSKGMYYRFS